jgi:hypothetical protein
MRAAKAVRVVSLEAIRSAIPQESPDRRSELRMAGLSFHADFGILVLPSSIGIHKLLGRADTLRRQASRDTITSLDLFRASLPFWSDPTIEQLVIGVGVTVELAMAASSRVIEGGTYSRWMCFEPQ